MENKNISQPIGERISFTQFVHVKENGKEFVMAIRILDCESVEEAREHLMQFLKDYADPDADRTKAVCVANIEGPPETLQGFKLMEISARGEADLWKDMIERVEEAMEEKAEEKE